MCTYGRTVYVCTYFVRTLLYTYSHVKEIDLKAYGLLTILQKCSIYDLDGVLA